MLGHSERGSHRCERKLYKKQQIPCMFRLSIIFSPLLKVQCSQSRLIFYEDKIPQTFDMSFFDTLIIAYFTLRGGWLYFMVAVVGKDIFLGLPDISSGKFQLIYII